MQTQGDFKKTSRRRFRSFKYSVVNSHLDAKFEPIKTDYHHSRNRPIINPNKLRSFSSLKKASPNSNQTIDATAEKENYLKTFLSFMNKTKPNDPEDKQNIQCMVLVPRFPSSLDKNNSDFTFLDTMTKPVQFIQNSLHSASKELHSQKYNIALLKSELEILNNQTTRTLEDIQNQVRARVKILQQTVGTNEVLQTERRLRNKKEIRLLERTQISNSNICQSMEERSIQVEQKIFNCQPFDFNLDVPDNQQEIL